MESIEGTPAIVYRQPFDLIIIPRKQVDSKEFLEHFKNGDFSGYWQGFPFRALLECRQPDTVIKEIFLVFENLIKIDPEIFHKFHKGNPYYWLGVAYFRLQDYASAVYFMNAAVKEDLDLPKPNSPSPATWFIELDSRPKNQAGRDLVYIAETEMNRLIESYNRTLVESSITDVFSIEILRNKLLKKATDINKQQYQTIATSFISFVLEFNNRIQSLKILDSLESVEPFVLHLFKGCVILESILKESPKLKIGIKSTNDLITWIKNKSIDLYLPPSIELKAKNLQSIIKDLPTGQLNLENCFSIACKIRNKTGHSLEWEFTTTERQYQILFEAIGISCLHSINRLY